jgi:hypothetical protein
MDLARTQEEWKTEDACCEDERRSINCMGC